MISKITFETSKHKVNHSVEKFLVYEEVKLGYVEKRIVCKHSHSPLTLYPILATACSHLGYPVQTKSSAT